MIGIEDQLLATTITFLSDHKLMHCAGFLVEADMIVNHNNWSPHSITIDLPVDSYNQILSDEKSGDIIKRAVSKISQGHFLDQNDSIVHLSPDEVNFRVKLIEVDDNWRHLFKDKLLKDNKSIQGLITSKMFREEDKDVILYNEMKFASQSEVRIAQELEKQKVLFFPLPLAVRHETGNKYNDHREVDFLICVSGKTGILEVAYHRDRYEKDSEKSNWFKKSGILCVQYYTAEKCYNNSSEVVGEFLEILSKH